MNFRNACTHLADYTSSYHRILGLPFSYFRTRLHLEEGQMFAEGGVAPMVQYLGYTIKEFRLSAQQGQEIFLFS
jgi:hypothetical protein